MQNEFRIPRWLPAVLMMLIIFSFSATPSNDLPVFGLWDFVVKKTSHALGYAILALCYLYAFGANPRRHWFAFLLAFLYANTDEFHQSFVPGRHPSPIDVGIDSFGTVLALIFTYLHQSWIRKAA